MQYPLPRALTAGLLAVALVLGVAAGAARAEDEPAAPDEAKAIAWVDGWAAGSAQAQKDGKLVFLYFGRQSPT